MNKSQQLAELLFNSSMDQAMKDKWIELLPKMNNSQINELHRILIHESEEEHKLEEKVKKFIDDHL